MLSNKVSGEDSPKLIRRMGNPNSFSASSDHQLKQKEFVLLQHLHKSSGFHDISGCVLRHNIDSSHDSTVYAY